MYKSPLKMDFCNYFKLINCLRDGVPRRIKLCIARPPSSSSMPSCGSGTPCAPALIEKSTLAMFEALPEVEFALLIRVISNKAVVPGVSEKVKSVSKLLVVKISLYKSFKFEFIMMDNVDEAKEFGPVMRSPVIKLKAS